MELTKLFLLCCSVLVSFSKCDDTTTVTEKQGQLEQTSESSIDQNYGVFRRFNKLTNNLRQCFCFLQKPTGVTVTQKLNPNGDKLERLVVYLYKDGSSDDFKIYLPNYEKQLMIPDLALDRGDILERPSDKIESMFNKYPHLKTNRGNIDIPDIAQIIDPVTLDQNAPINFDEGKIPNNIENPLDPNNNGASPSERELNKYPFEPVSPDEDQISPDDKRYDDFPDIKNSNKKPLSDNIEPVTIESNPPQELDSSQDPNELEDLQDKTMKVVQINQNFDVNPLSPNKITKDNIASPSGENKINIHINLDMSGTDEEPTDRPTKIDVTQKPNHHVIHAVPKVEIKNPIPIIHDDITKRPEVPISNIYKNIHTTPTKPFIWNNLKTQHIYSPANIKKIVNYVPERKIVPVIPTGNSKLWHHNIYQPKDRKILTLHPHRLIHKYQDQDRNEGHDGDTQETFDSWLIHQLQNVQFADSEASNSIDIYTLKYLIEETLRKSGFFIANNGLLVDSKGVKIHMANLVLRPILIGNSVEYKKLLKGKVSTFKLPTDLPYLEAVLITSIKPQKIIGIIPLGKTFLPKDYRTPLSLYVQDAPQDGCNKCIQKGYQTNQFYPTDFNPSRVEQFYNQYPNSWVSTNYRPYIQKQRYRVNQMGPRPYTTPIQQDGIIKESRRVFPFDQVNTVIDKLYKVPLSVDKIKYVDRPYVVQPVVTQETYQTVPIIKYPYDVVTPGFRIIGGNAATSSGTPVSSKGRSGIEPEQVKTIDEE